MFICHIIKTLTYRDIFEVINSKLKQQVGNLLEAWLPELRESEEYVYATILLGYHFLIYHIIQNYQYWKIDSEQQSGWTKHRWVLVQFKSDTSSTMTYSFSFWVYYESDIFFVKTKINKLIKTKIKKKKLKTRNYMTNNDFKFPTDRSIAWTAKKCIESNFIVDY